VVDPNSSEIVVEPLTDWSAFAPLRGEWNALAARCVRPSVFLTHEWLDAAWQWKGRDSSMRTLCARRAGRLVGALPLVRSKRQSRSGSRCVLEFLTVPDTQFCDVLVLQEHRQAVADCFAGFLQQHQNEWDTLDLGYLPEGSVVEADLVASFLRRGHHVDARGAGTNPYIGLEGTWEEYYSTRSRSLKKANNLAANRINKSGEVSIRWYAPGTFGAAQLPGIVDALVSISSRSWKRDTGNSLDHPGPQAFIRRLSELAAGQHWLSVWALELDATPVAMECQLIFDGNVHALRSDFDATFSEISPGSHLNRHLLERLFCGRFQRYYMGPGENAYKLRWTERSENLHRVTVYGSGVQGQIAALVDLRIAPLARWMRAFLRRKDSVPGEEK
jgi:hypothetical protein